MQVTISFYGSSQENGINLSICHEVGHYQYGYKVHHVDQYILVHFNNLFYYVVLYSRVKSVNLYFLSFQSLKVDYV